MKLNKIERKIISFYERLRYGYKEEDFWSLDLTFTEFILPRLIHFKKIKCGYPSDLTEETWDDILQTMIEAFQLIVDNDGDTMFLSTLERQKLNQGLKLFSEYFNNLWI